MLNIKKTHIVDIKFMNKSMQTFTLENDVLQTEKIESRQNDTTNFDKQRFKVYKFGKNAT